MRMLLCLVSLTALLCGCMASKASRYYLLEAEPPQTHAAVFLQRIDLPVYLEQNSLIRRVGRDRLEFIEGHSWVGSFRRLLEDGISEGLASGAKHGIAIKVRRFEAANDGRFHAELECIDGNEIRRIAYSFPCDSSNAAGIVSGYTNALAELHRRLAELYPAP